MVTTTQDPIIQRLAKEKEGNVFCTDAILATLMTCTRSNYSWDIIVQKIGDKLFFDKREDSDFGTLWIIFSLFLFYSVNLIYISF